MKNKLLKYWQMFRLWMVQKVLTDDERFLIKFSLDIHADKCSEERVETAQLAKLFTNEHWL